MKCEIGDLAVLIYSEFPENVGGLVEVIATTDEPGLWLCRALQPLMTQEENPPHRQRLAPAGDIGAVRDEHLHPIRGQRSAKPDPVHQFITEHAGS